jgi:signal transduction histidine kinase
MCYGPNNLKNLEIRQKLTLRFTVLVGLLLLAVLGFNYYLAFLFARDSFYDRLKSRAIAIVGTHLEGPSRVQLDFDSLESVYHQVLPGEAIYLLDKKFNVKYSFSPDSFLVDKKMARLLVQSGKPIQEHGDRMIMSTTLNVARSEYYLIASARDIVGSSKLQYMLQSMILSFLIFLVFTVLAGQVLAKNALMPIKSVISQVNSISAQNFYERVKYEDNKDEIAQLSATFNLMLDRLEDAFNTQSAFVSNASHELRNPIAAMIGQAEITLMKEREIQDYQSVLTAIHADATRLKLMVNSLLQLSQASAGQIKAQICRIRLDELVLDLVENLSKTKGYTHIDVHLPENPEDEILVDGSPGLLDIAISNLIDNACKYSGEKPVLVSIEPQKQHWQLKIEDHGIGMSPEELSFCTEPFYRSPDVRHREGFGIGLTVSKKILGFHHIDMAISSEKGVGTLVILTFP